MQLFTSESECSLIIRAKASVASLCHFLAFVYQCIVFNIVLYVFMFFIILLFIISLVLVLLAFLLLFITFYHAAREAHAADARELREHAGATQVGLRLV